MSRSKRKEEFEKRMNEAMGVLTNVSQDTTTPRNIRRAAKNAMEVLQVSEHTLAVRASNAISLLDEISQDPNMPPYTRVKLWNVASLLEAIKDWENSCYSAFIFLKYDLLKWFWNYLIGAFPLKIFEF